MTTQDEKTLNAVADDIAAPSIPIPTPQPRVQISLKPGTAIGRHELPRDPGALKELTASENRRWNMIIQRAVSAELMRASLPPPLADQVDSLPLHLITTNRIQQRWAVGHGDGLPWSQEDIDRIAEVEEQDDTFTVRQSRPPPLDDATQTVIDQLIGPDPERRVRGQYPPRPVGAVPGQAGRFIWQWYCKPVTCGTMARERGMSPAGLLSYWHMILEHLRGKYIASTHEDLRSLVMALP